MAIQAFLLERKKPPPHISRLILRKNQLHLVNKDNLSFWIKFKAKFGCGNASMKKIVAYIEANREVLFPVTNEKQSTNDKNEFNHFLSVSYNPKRTFSFKRVRTISAISAESLNKSSLSNNNLSKDSYNSIKHAFKGCRMLYNQLIQEASKRNIQQLMDQIIVLTCCMEDWELSSKINRADFKKEKSLLNEILNFKNEVRAACLDKKDKSLKGDYLEGTHLLDAENQELLKIALKNLRGCILNKYFSVRLEKDKARLAELQLRFSENKGQLSFEGQGVFLQTILDRWQKKLDQGKPINIPKWYHCTKTNDVLQTILDSYILYMHQGFFAGCFTANFPEWMYGSYCIAMSDHIEKTGTHNPGSDEIVYPQFTKWIEEQTIHYSDELVPSLDGNLNDQNAGISLWLGYQRGAKTLGLGGKDKGTEGIPLKLTSRFKSKKPLSYYKDTTVAFIVSLHKDSSIEQIARERRIQAYQFEQVEALRLLVNSTFKCTLPKTWENKLVCAD